MEIINILKIFWDLLKPFILIILVLIIINIIYCQIKYKNVFNPFKKRTKIDERKRLLFLLLDKLPQYKKIFCLKKLNSTFVMVSESGIYLLNTFYANGLLEGNLSGKYVTIKHRSYLNPLIQIEEDYKKIISIYPDLNIKKYVIVSNDCLLDKIPNNINVIHLSNFYYKIEKDIKNIMMNKEEVDKIYNDLIKSKLN